MKTPIPSPEVDPEREFLARGLASRAQAKRSGEYYRAADVLDELDAMLNEAERKAGK